MTTYNEFLKATGLLQVTAELQAQGLNPIPFLPFIDTLLGSGKEVRSTKLYRYDNPDVFANSIRNGYDIWVVEGDFAKNGKQWDVTKPQVVGAYWDKTLEVCMYEPGEATKDILSYWEDYKTFGDAAVRLRTGVFPHIDTVEKPVDAPSGVQRERYQEAKDAYFNLGYAEFNRLTHGTFDLDIKGLDQPASRFLAAMVLMYPELLHLKAKPVDFIWDKTPVGNCIDGVIKWFSKRGVHPDEEFTMQDFLKFSLSDHIFEEGRLLRTVFWYASKLVRLDFHKILELSKKPTMSGYIDHLRQVPYSNESFGTKLTSFSVETFVNDYVEEYENDSDED